MDDECTLKERINQFVWANAPGTLTLDDAEEIAVEIHQLLRPEVWELESEVPGPPDPPRPAERTEIG